jgi:hypothetical protein
MEHDNHRNVRGKGPGILKGKRHILLVAAVLMIIALVILHAVAANSIYKALGFSVKNLLSYLMIGGFVVLLAFKLKLLWRFKTA